MQTSRTSRTMGAGGLLVLLGAQLVRAATVNIDVATKYQTIRGFGASTAWGSSMSAADADLLWSTTTGAGLSLHRVHIDPSNGSTSELAIAKLAVARNVTVWASPWTPPAAYKSNNSTVMGTLSNPSAYATYLTGFVKKMKDNGVPIYAVSAQNEPDASVNYESCVYDGASMATWVGGTMGPAFAGSGVKIMGPESQNWCGLQKFWPVLKASTAFMKYADIIATHEYGCNPSAYPDIQAAGKEFWETEMYDWTGPANAGMTSALRVAKLIHEAMTISSMNAWHFWWVYPSTDDNGALWDKTSNKPSKRLWVEGNYSRFVRPGYVRIGATVAPTAGVTLSAYYSSTDLKVVVVAVNTNTSATNQAFTLAGATGMKMTPWVTDPTQNIVAQPTVTLNGNAFSYSLPSQSVTSLVIDLAQIGVGQNLSKREENLHLLREAEGYRVQLPTAEAARLEMLGADGRRLESWTVPAGSSEYSIRSPKRSGVYVLNLVDGHGSWTTEIVQP